MSLSPCPGGNWPFLQGDWQVEQRIDGQRWVAKPVDQLWFSGSMLLLPEAYGRAPIDIGSPTLYLSDRHPLGHGLVRISQKGDHHYGDAKEA